MPSPANVLDLRRMLSERFPSAHLRPVSSKVPALATGVPELDVLLGGGLPKGEVTELVGEGDGSGSAQVIHALVGQAAREGRFLALVDAADSFDVDAPASAALSRLLWVRCRGTEEAFKATDLLLRDRNIPLVILDLKPVSLAQCRKVPSSVWHRYARITEHQGTTLLVVTPCALVGSVAVRVETRAQLGLEALQALPALNVARLRFQLLRSSETGWRAGGAA
ncbi:MAG: hypothetical protein IT581_08220 [Verrucomicrobiales bacterium]|nr:hypothetical protein [Verrucomicrobiales bacterium]